MRLRLAAWVAGILPESLRRAIYRAGPLARLLRGALTRAAPEGLTEVQVAAGPVSGARLWLDLKREKTLWLGNYELELLRAIERFGRPGMLAYDVGANIGYVSLALARRAGPQGAVVAFEPLPANLTRLHRNLSLNPEGERVTVIGAAVGDRTGQAEFLIHRSGGMGKLAGAAGRTTEYDGKLSVERVALDDWFADHGGPAPNLIKLDVEGGEALALRGMQGLLISGRPVLLIELHGQAAAGQARAILDQAGYQLRAMRAGYPSFEPGESWKNYVVGLPAERTASGEAR